MKVRLAEALHQHLPAMKVHLLVVRAVKLEVLRYFQVEPPALDPERVETLIVRWRALYRPWLGEAAEAGAMESLLRCVMNQRFVAEWPLIDMARYASLLSCSPISAYALETLHDGLTLDVVPEELRVPAWLDGRGQTVSRVVGAAPHEANRLRASTNHIVFIGEQPDTSFPSPERGMRYLQATLGPLCDSLQGGLLDLAHGPREFDAI
ncbi:MAG: hypothetical protein JO171_09405 [Paludibacterium sp.]|uniref:hypothetical protein n=1 Tax=Paludibacterium sp. TaxID=1917523 RepID=UPI0025FF0A02|nr:hypothetical protein [Paludibacterium sp.]MBV8047358.1 hypothetical protein [Paludibacterium sp.]MBV8646291.1 hypothetical protein [Paludibacterium sp.]